MRLNLALEAIGENLIAASIWDAAVDHMNVGDAGWYDRFRLRRQGGSRVGWVKPSEGEAV